ncbi:hypothetical protein A3K63_02555 [Candidatus Micrarchaeota archaeon RBG_16_49_10]|nr:MAG: hypothetical protein A3K63_02555 [Candidatus Micrarchaeota archaeon RBG_16_49_10]
MINRLKVKLSLAGSAVASFFLSRIGLAQYAQPEYGMIQPLYGVQVKYGVIQPLYGVIRPLTFWERVVDLLSRPLVLGMLLVFLAIGIFLVIKHRKGLNAEKSKVVDRKRPV